MLIPENFQLYYLIAFLYQVSGYIIVAANLEDLRTATKEIVPDHLAETLFEAIASKAFSNKRREEVDSDEYSRDQSRSVSRFKIQNMPKAKNTEVDIDALVDKVKSRFEEEFYEKYGQRGFMEKLAELGNIKKKSDVMVSKKRLETTMKPWYDKKPKFLKDVNNVHENEEVPVEEVETATDESSIYSKFNLFDQGKSDSYEDYVLPNKDETEDIIKPVKKIGRNEQPVKLQIGFKPTPEEYDDEINPKEEIKARTEKLGISYETDEKIEIKQFQIKQEPKNKHPESKGKGTMRPTRHTYKMSSPNYLARIPKVVEKYNFDEPLPMKDQNSEELRQFGDPPSNINGKVRV